MKSLDRRRFLAVAAAMSAAPAVRARIGLDLFAPPDDEDGKTFRSIAMHDVRDDLLVDRATVLDTCALSTASVNTIFAWIKEKDFHPVTVDQIVAARNGGAPLPPRAILLTFDDAYKSQFMKVFPLLKHYGYPAVVGVVTRWTNTPQGESIRISHKSIMPPGYFMSWSDLREMARSGLVEIASHTHDMHHGSIANPQGNELPSASTHLYLDHEARYETDDEYEARIYHDLSTSVDLIRQNTGVSVRSAIWPYGMYNAALIRASQKLGMEVHLTLDDGPNTADVPLTKIRRQLVAHDWDAGTMIDQMRMSAAYRGERNPVERVVTVSLDDVYDPSGEKHEEKLSRLLDRIKDLAPKSVYLKAYADPDGTGVAQATYFPNRHMPMRADLFNRVAWQLITRTEVQVYASMPLLGFALPRQHPAADRVVLSQAHGSDASAPKLPRRLSPFDDVARRTIQEIYFDLACYASFNGVVYEQDAMLGEHEDASDAALAVYAKWGLPPDLKVIQASADLMRRWSEAKTAYLIDLTHQLTSTVRDYQGGGNVLTVRALPASALFLSNADIALAQNLNAFVAAYDFIALGAAHGESGKPVTKHWLTQVAKAVAGRPGAQAKTVFELDTIDPQTGQHIDTTVLRDQMLSLNGAGVVHLAYGPDDFLNNRPDTKVLRDVMSIQSSMSLLPGKAV
jgi:biofilm PGA synthesis lipoprotein PgaB